MQHRCHITVPYGLVTIIFAELFAFTAAIFACLFAFKASRSSNLADGACAEVQGHQMASLVSNDENATRGYIEPIKPGYTTSLVKDDNDTP